MDTLKAFVALLLPALALSQATITTPPTDTAGLQGESASLLCQISGEQPALEVLQFRKIHPGSPVILSVDNDTASSKYEVSGRYRLHILNLTVADEGIYQCSLNSVNHEANLTVSVAPRKVELYWPNHAVHPEISSEVNLTCKVTHSRPEATIRWYKGDVRITDGVYHPEASPDAAGFADTYSMLTLTPRQVDVGTAYKCLVDLPGAPGVAEETTTITSSAVHQATGGLLSLFAAFILARICA